MIEAPKPLDCGNNPCLFATSTKGMRTQGRCRCMDRIGEILGIGRIPTVHRLLLEHVLRATIEAHKRKAVDETVEAMVE